MRCVARYRSATRPTKNGDTIAATAVVPNARPICWPENFSVCPSHVPIVTDHAPQTKYWRNISVASFSQVVCVIRPRQVRLRRRHCPEQPTLHWPGGALGREFQAFLHFFNWAGGAAVLVFDVGADRPLLALEQRQHLANLCVARA